MKVLFSTFLFLSTAAFANGFSSVGAVNGVGPTGGEELQPIEDLLPSQAQDIKDANDMLSVASQHFSESAQVKIRQLSAKMRERATETDPDRLRTLNDEISALEDAIKAEATAAELAAAREFYVEISQLDSEAQAEAFDTPQPQDPDNPFYLTASPTSQVWNQPIQLAAYGGMNGTISYQLLGGPCRVEVSGMVISTNGQAAATCSVQARRTAAAGFFQQSEPVTVQFTLQCPEEGQALTATASKSSANVGEAVTISASGGGCDGTIQFYETAPTCSVSSSGTVSATQAGDCAITVTKASPGAINPAQQQVVVISFADPDAGGPLNLSASTTNAALGATVSMIVTGGTGQALFGVRGTGCSVNSNGQVSSSGARTCEGYVNKGSETASVCINFGGGGPNPPVACAPEGSLDGPLEIAAPTGPVTLSEGASGSYFGGYQLSATGGGTGQLRFEPKGSNPGCTVGQAGNVTVSTTLTGLTCTVQARRFGGPEGTVLSNNSVTIVFGDADPDAGGSEVFEPLVIASEQGSSANVGEMLQLSFSGGRSGNPTFGNADLPTGCSISTSGSITRSDAGVCHVSAYDAPDTSNALCITFGDVQLDPDSTCAVLVVEEVQEEPTLISEGDFQLSVSHTHIGNLGEIFAQVTLPAAALDNTYISWNLSGSGCSSINQSLDADTNSITLHGVDDASCRLRATITVPSPFQQVQLQQCVHFNTAYGTYGCPAPTGSPSAGNNVTGLQVSASSVPTGGTVVFTAVNAGAVPWFGGQAPFGFPSNACSPQPTGVSGQRQITSNQNLTCAVTVAHDDSFDRAVTRCVSFGEGASNPYCP